MNVKNKFSKIFLSSLILLLVLFSFTALAEDTYPTPTDYKYVNDYVGIITDSQAKSIVSIGKELEDKTGAQVAIVIINSTSRVPIEDYSNKLFRTWGLGQKDKDNGILIVLALEDKKWKVEVGRGLEGAIPDALSSRIMNSVAVPQFRDGNYGEGLVQSYSVIADHVSEEYGITLDKSLNITLPKENSSNNNTRNSKLLVIVVAVLFFADLIFNRGRIFSSLLQVLFWSNIGRGGRGPGGGSGGSSGGGGFGGFGGGSSNGGGSSGSW
ncbi:MAG: TPM domain-containing protein [Clostridium sp.]|uniref:TPM domain-containing protein n=1 Tax=Clostridium sp. TaxID=1506 RepID=UPI00306BB379